MALVKKINQSYPTGGLVWKITASKNNIPLFWKILLLGML